MAVTVFDLVRSTPVRQAVGIVALTAVLSVGSTGIAYLRVRDGMEETISAALETAATSFAAARTTEELRAQVASEAEITDPEQRVIVFLAAEGPAVGNALARMDKGKPKLTALSDGHELSDRGYSFRVIADARGTLVLGESREVIEEMRGVFVALVAFSLVPTLLLSLAAALVIAARSARRVVRIEGVLDQLTDGNLAARVGDTSPRNDDLSRIAGGLDRMAAAQEQSVSALKQVSADIAHDLKTPVQRVALLMADLRDRVAEGSPEADLAERAVAEANRAVGVFQSLLQIAQIEGGGPRARFRDVDLAAIVETFAEIYGPTAEDSGHILKLDLPETGLAVVRGDKDLLGQLVANLIENALRHTPPGTTIRLALSRQRGQVTLSVVDNGPGIPRAEHDLVLRRLYRLERSRTTQGNGLGLALVAAVADLHEASLQLSDTAPGLTVTLTFPDRTAQTN